MPRIRSTALNRAAALAASVSMLVPGFAVPAAAQTADDIVAACTAEFGTDADATKNCIDERTSDAAAEAEAAVEAEAQAAADAAAQAESDAAVQAEADAAAEEEAARQAEAQAAADAAAQAEADAVAQAEADAAAQAEAEAAAEEEAARQAEAQAAADAAAQAEADAAAQAEAEAAAEEEAARQAEAQAAADAAAQAEADAVAQAEAEAAAEEEAARQAEAQAAADAAAQAEAEAAAQAEAEAAAEEEAARQAEAQAAADAAAQAEADAVAPTTEETPLVETPTESAIAAEVAARPEPELTEDQQTAVNQAQTALGALLGGDSATAAASAAVVDGDETSADTVVEEEVVEQGDIRTSDQDFATRAVVTEQEDRFDRNDKILLGALGALAVGAILVNQNNRARVVSNSGDRVVVQQDDGSLRVLKDDDVLLRQAGSNVRTERFDDGSTRTTVLREDGSRVVTIRDASLRVLRRELITEGGERYTLIDDTVVVEPVDVSTLPEPVVSSRATATDDPLAAALRQQEQLDRRFSLAQVRNIAEVRALAPAFEVSTVTFASGSAAIVPEQAGNLRGLANEVLAAIRANPREIFLVEGHTDAVGDAAYNLALSDRRAESLALALNEYFGVPVENMVVQGYGESFLKVQTQGDEQANRRATVRQITDLLQTAAAN
ncbi:Outer membrane protein OmpA [Jannaschia faecimaris]|uniref:Outer membrane protein OmpA n=1 Tax=Jannaschia faecimaris TaxID=1244108 RepID=A0A1H3RLJ1_9RHOB|nr:OmpA family protein [Jannaschia faecimaris]SDZ26510.1 Outer membrane protein OmpA [Jannaschia faecimaris]